MAPHKHDVTRKLRQYQSEPRGNWRLKAMLYAALEGVEETVGEAWPTHDRFLAETHKSSPYRAMHNPEEGIHNTVRPAQREGAERALARDTFDDMDEAIPRDQYIKRMLLRGSAEELDTLWREELLTTVVEAAQLKEVARDAATVVPVDAKKGDWPRGSAAAYANKTAEGGRIEEDMEDYDTVAYDCTKYTQGFSVTDEMVSEVQINAIERQVQFAGKAIENSLNRLYLNSLIDSVYNVNDVDTDQATPTYTEVQGINHAVALIEADDYEEPDSLIVHPEFKAEYFDEAQIAYANYSGSDSAIRGRVFDPIFGLNMLTASTGTYNAGTVTWGWGADAERGAVAVNSDFVAIFMYQDISTKDFEDPIRDIQGGNARAWFDVQVLRDNAHATLQY